MQHFSQEKKTKNFSQEKKNFSQEKKTFSTGKRGNDLILMWWRRSVYRKYKYKYKYKHNNDKDKDKDKPNDVKYDKDKPSDVKVNCVTYDPYCAPHTWYTDDSESEDDYMIMNTLVHL